MNIKKYLAVFVMAFAMILSLVPYNEVQADTDFNIISSTEVTASEAGKWAKSKGATDTFVSLAKLYWKYAEDCGDVNPAIAYVQAAKETGYGKFGGVLNESYHNPCGMKTSSGGGDYDANAHQKFNSWDEGVQAHMDHLALYAGASGYPKSNTYDPRHFVTIKGKAPTVNSLGGRWAPSATYGQEVGKLYMDLMDYADVDYSSDDSDNNSNSNSNNNSSSDYDDEEDSTNEKPNPGKAEAKPSGLSVSDVVVFTKNDDKKTDSTPNITSKNGWKMEDNKWYYYKDDGNKAVGWIKPDSNWYYLNTEDGSMKTGWMDINGTWYYLENSGAMATGWRLLGGSWYLLKDSGAMAEGIESDGKNLYVFENSGAMSEREGWLKYNNNWYYTQSNGQAKIGWLKEGGVWYYMQGDGTMVNGVKKIDGKVYSFYDNGAMQTGWKQSNSNWYYFANDGSMATGWTNDGSKSYYMYDNGAMAKGWLEINGTWYYLNKSGDMATGWLESNGDYYYLDKTTGRMLTNTTIDGYKIKSNGKRGSKVTSSNNSTNNSGNSSSSSGSSSGSSSTPKNKTIVIDAGHDYGKDYGAEATIGGVKYSETVLNMEVADKLEKELKSRGYTVLMVRNLGEKPASTTLTESLSQRVNLANNSNADLYISIHHNSAGATAKGVETLYSSNPQDSTFGGSYNSNKISVSKNLATLINNNIASKLNLVNRGGKDQNLYVCRNTNMPAVLVEVGFITNAEEAKRCADSASQQKVAEAIAEVVGKNF